MWKMVKRFERQAEGIELPEAVTAGAWKPISDHLLSFLAGLSAQVEAGHRSVNTLKAYRRCIPKLCVRCGWKYFRDVSSSSFEQWRERNQVSPKMANDLLGYMRSFLNWARRDGRLACHPLESVRPWKVKEGHGHRRALSDDELRRLFAVVPFKRAAVYRFAVSTGLRRWELNRVTWADVDQSGSIRLPDTITKNGKRAVLPLNQDALDALEVLRPKDCPPTSLVFRGKVPNMETFRRDLLRAEIPFSDSFGRRVDFHALRTTMGTRLQASGVSPRAAMELMRHSDMKLTMRVYTDASLLGLRSEISKMPPLSFGSAIAGAEVTPTKSAAAVFVPCAQIDAQTQDVSGLVESPPGAVGRLLASDNASASVTSRHTKTPSDLPGGVLKLVDPIRFELTTSSMPLRRSSN